MKRLHDRDDVSGFRFTRAEPSYRGSQNRDLLRIVDSIFPGGSVFHVITDTPDDTGDLMVIVVDGTTVISFELPRLEGTERCTAGPALDVEITTIRDFRAASGQRSHRMLDNVLADAHRVMANVS